MPYKNKEDLSRWQSTRRAKRREQFLQELGGKCVKCGSKENLEFDHTDPNTKVACISELLPKSISKIKTELEKCQILCFKCHRTKTGKAKHGTRSKYTAGCRCEECTTANREYYRTYWASKKR